MARVEGAVTLERDGRPDNAPLNMPLLSGDRLRTADGRADVRYDDGSALLLDRQTAVDFQSDDLLRLMDGRVRLTIDRRAADVAYRIDSPAGSVRITEPGEYRVSLLHDDTETQIELAVLRGAGDVFTEAGETHVRAGERAYASAGLLPSDVYAFNSALSDDLDRWGDADRDARAGASAEYLPEDVQSYSTVFDEYGDWRYQPTYGYVWYPRVASTWRPYYYGRWMTYPRYGWTWIGADAFAWPTHHYGRWGFSAGAWFWIPAARWAPAYVSWAYAPGYVSWCPLGFDNRPVIGLSIGIGPRYYSPWSAWTVVAATHFGRGYVPSRVIRTAAWDGGGRPAFRVRPTGPAYDVAVPRGSSRATPILSAGRYARGGAVGTQRSELGALAATRVGRAGPGSKTAVRPERGAPGNGWRETPRYVNRGDHIIRSQTARPSPPSRSGAPAYRTSPTPLSRDASPVARPRVGAGTAAPSQSPVERTRPGARTDERSVYRPNYTPDYRPNYAPNYRPNYAPDPRTYSAPARPRYSIPPDGDSIGRNPAYRPRYQPGYRSPLPGAGAAVPRGALPSPQLPAPRPMGGFERQRMGPAPVAPQSRPAAPAGAAPRGGSGGAPSRAVPRGHGGR